MKRLLVAMCLFLMPLPVLASDWNRTDVALEATYLTLHVMDWGQTLDIADRGEEYHEQNPILGKHPTRADVNTYFAATALLHLAIANWLDRPARNYFQAGTIAVEAAVIGNNFRIGLTLAY